MGYIMRETRNTQTGRERIIKANIKSLQGSN
jgi:hypothetical protein